MKTGGAGGMAQGLKHEGEELIGDDQERNKEAKEEDEKGQAVKEEDEEGQSDE